MYTKKIMFRDLVNELVKITDILKVLLMMS